MNREGVIFLATRNIWLMYWNVNVEIPVSVQGELDVVEQLKVWTEALDQTLEKLLLWTTTPSIRHPAWQEATPVGERWQLQFLKGTSPRCHVDDIPILLHVSRHRREEYTAFGYGDTLLHDFTDLSKVTNTGPAIIGWGTHCWFNN